MTIKERIAELRKLIRPSDLKAVGFRAGQQTHEYQDAARLVNEHLDEIEKEIEEEAKPSGGKR